MATKWLPKAARPRDPRLDLPERPAKGWTFPSGAYVQDSKKVEYYVTPAQGEKWQQMVDDKTISNEEFWAWWEDFRKEYFLTPRGTWGKSSRSTSGLSGWWQYDLHGAFGAANSNLDRKLTMALRSVATTVRIVDDSTPPFVVEWASEEDTSATNLEGRRIAINPKPITKPGTLTSAEAIDICIAFGLHEAGHAKETSKVSGILLDEHPEPWAVSMFLANTLEDIRTEALTSKEYPGFAKYFDVAKDYMWDDMKERGIKPPTEYGKSLADCLNAILGTLKWPNKTKDLFTDPSFEELDWWRDWSDRYQANKMPLYEAVKEGLERLKTNTSEEVQEQLAKLASDMAGDEHIEGVMDACTNAHGEAIEGTTIDSETADAVRKNVQEKMREWTPKIHPDGVDEPTVTVSHPLETVTSKAAYIGKPSGIVERLRELLQFRPEKPQFADRLLKTGSLDEEQLFRFPMGDFRMFQKEVIESYPNAQVSLLVDMSGSMMGSATGSGYYRGSPDYRAKVHVAQELAQLFVTALDGMRGVTPKVFGHTGDLVDGEDGRGTAEFYELWEKGEPMTRLGLISSMDHGDNFDGFAIEWCVEELRSRGDLNDQRLLIVLSDGEPAGHGYGDHSAEMHVRQVTDMAEKNGVFVVQVAIDPHMRSAVQSKMFRNWVQFTSVNELPKGLTKVLSGYLNR